MVFTNIILRWQSREPTSVGRCPVYMALPKQLTVPSGSGLWMAQQPCTEPEVDKPRETSMVLV